MERELGNIKAMLSIIIILVFMQVTRPRIPTGVEMPKDEVFETCACGYIKMYSRPVPKAGRGNK